MYRLLTVFAGPEVTLYKQQAVKPQLLTIQLLIKIALDASSAWKLPAKTQISAAVKLTYLRVEELSSGEKYQGYNFLNFFNEAPILALPPVISSHRLSFFFAAGGDSELLEEDEQMVDQAIDGHLFEFLTTSVVAAQDFHSDVCRTAVVTKQRLFGIVIQFCQCL